MALAAALLMVWTPVAGAAPAPVIVFHAASDGDHARAALAAIAARNATVLLDLSPQLEPPPRAPQLLARGIDAYHDLRYEAARGHLDEALAEAARTGARGLGPSDLSDLRIYRALVFTEQGNSSGAWDDFVRAAAIDPTRKLDPVRFPPRVAETFQRAVDAVAAAARSQVTVAGDAGCQAWLDGRAIAVATPVATPVGEHFVRVECAGRRPYGTLVVVSGAAQTVRPVVAAEPRADVARVAALARRRGAAWVVLAEVTVSPGVAPTVRLQLVAAATAAGKDSVVVAADGDVAAAAQRLIDQVVSPGPSIVGPVKVAPTPWYRKPWVWGVAGAAVATAVLLPLALDSGSAAAFDVEPVWP